MRWIAAPLVVLGLVFLSFSLFQKKPAPTTAAAPQPSVAEVVTNVVRTAAPKVHAAERKIAPSPPVQPAETVVEELPAPKPRVRRLTAEESFAFMTRPAREAETAGVVRYHDPNANKWLKPSDFSLQNREKKEIEAECDEWKCPLSEKKTIPVFGFVVRPDGDDPRLGDEVKTGSFVEKTPALYLE